jgi:hypothetical protein
VNQDKTFIIGASFLVGSVGVFGIAALISRWLF